MAKKDKRDKDEVTKDDGASTTTADRPRAEGVELENAPPELNPNLGPNKARPGTGPGIDGTAGELHAFDQAALAKQVGDLTDMKQGLTVGHQAGPGVDDMQKLVAKHGGTGGLDLPIRESKDGGPPTGKNWGIYGQGKPDAGTPATPPPEKSYFEQAKDWGQKQIDGVMGGGATGVGKDPNPAGVDPLTAKGTGDPWVTKALAAKREAEIAAKQAQEVRTAQAKADKAAKDQAAKDQAAKDQAAKDQAAKDQAAKDQAAKDEAARKAAEAKKGMVNPDADDGSTAPAWVTTSSGPVVVPGSEVSKPVNPDVGGGNGGNGTLDPSKVRIGGIDPGVVDKNPDYDEAAPVGTAELRGRPDEQLTNFGNPKDNLTPTLPPGGAAPSGGGGGAGPDKGRGAPEGAIVEPAPSQVVPPPPAPVAVQEAPLPAPAVNVGNDFNDPPAVTTSEPGPPPVPEDDGRD